MISIEELSPYKFVIFDYDSTIAKIPIDWPKARLRFREYLQDLIPGLSIPQNSRVDEMELLALKAFPNMKDSIFMFRLELETQLDGKHEGIKNTIELIRDLAVTETKELLIVSNNLRRTVVSGLSQFSLNDCFSAVFGVDDVGFPKPSTDSFCLIEQVYDVLPSECIFIGDNDRTDGGFAGKIGMGFYNITHLN
ncbi:MAG: HAD family hydrolase [Opitutales bacterium]